MLQTVPTVMQLMSQTLMKNLAQTYQSCSFLVQTRIVLQMMSLMGLNLMNQIWIAQSLMDNWWSYSHILFVPVKH